MSNKNSIVSFLKALAMLSVLAILNVKPCGAQADSFLVDGVYRNYILHLPVGYSSTSAYLPLVFNLHGYGSNAIQQEFYSQMDASADAHGYIVAYPNGLANYWNAFGSGADDIKFISRLIDTLAARYRVNLNRVYSCGMSNGGYMSYTLACSLSDRIAAIASVTGTMSLYTAANCSPSHPMPVLHIHGTADPTVPYATGAANSIGVEQTLAYWRQQDRCTNLSDTTALPDTNTTDGSTVQRIYYSQCDSSRILFYKVFNGGHTWPSGAVNLGGVGATNRDISATDEIWKFFNQYTLRGSLSIAEPAAVAHSVYPNPCASRLYLKSEEAATGAVIYDLWGRELIPLTQEQSIDVSGLAAGVYLLYLYHGSELMSPIKIVKE
jgi:polyhydroxybutyrate depolymerase